MALHVALNHRTEYVYDRLTGLGPQVVRLRPAAHSRTPILSYSLKITPKEHFINWQQDPFGNYLARLVFTEPTREFKVEVDLVADMATINPFDFFVDEYAGDWPFTYDDALKEEFGAYLKASEPGPLLKTYLSKLHFDVKTSLDFIWALNGQLQHDVKYLIRLEPGVQTPEETLTQVRLVPRLRLAAGADPAPSRARGALRVGLPDPAQGRREVARRPVGYGAGFHRSACLGRSLSARRRLDRARPHFRPVRGRRPHPARRDAVPAERRADHGRASRRPRSSSATDAGHAHRRKAARHHALYRRAMGRIDALGHEVDRRSTEATCA